MKFFRDLFFRQAPDYFTKLKYQTSLPRVLPLQECVFKGNPTTKKSWRIDQVLQTLGEPYFDNLKLPIKNRVNVYENLAQKGRTRKRGILQVTQTAFQCQSLETASPIQHFVIGLHHDAIISFMVIPKEGNRLKLCQGLCGTKELPDLDQLNNPEQANEFTFSFSENGGADLRGRASLAIRCDNFADINRAESFISAIHELAPFDQPMTHLIMQIIAHSKYSKPLANEIDILLDEKHELTAPERICRFYKAKVTEKVDELWEKTSEINQQLAWRIKGDFGTIKQFDLFLGFAHGIPDLRNEKNILVHYPESIRIWNNTIPAIHLSILASDLTQLNQILNKEPMEIFTRDPHGLLPIQLAYQTCQPELGSVIYAKWSSLPKSQQWAAKLFLRSAHDFANLEHDYSTALDHNNVNTGVQAYFSKQLPMIEQPLALYYAIQQSDKETIARLCQKVITPWETLFSLCSAGDLQGAKKIFAGLFQDKYALFAALLNDDRSLLVAALNDFIPDLTFVLLAVYYGEPGRLAYLSEYSICKDENEVHQILQLAKAIQAVIEEMDRVVAQLNQFNNPLADDKVFFRKRLDELWALDDKRNSLYSGSNIWREFENRKYISFNPIQNPILKFLEELKAKMRSHVKVAGYGDCQEVLLTELAYFEHANLIPHIALLIAFLNDDLKKATTLIQQHLINKQRTIAFLPSKEHFYPDHRTCNPIHQRVLSGHPLPIADFMRENELFVKFKQSLYSLYTAESQELAGLNHDLEIMNGRRFIRQEYNFTTEISLTDSLRYYINRLVFSTDEIFVLKNQFMETNNNLLNDALVKQQYFEIFEIIMSIKAKTIPKLQALILQYQQHCKCKDAELFDIFTILLAQHQATIAYNTNLRIIVDFRVNDLLLSRASKLAKSRDGAAKASLQTLTGCCRSYVDNEHIMNSLIRCNLLSFEHQDAWGYTPLLLAVSANRIDIVRSFFENNIASDWIVSFDERNVLFYSLLSHANTRSMLHLILHYYTNPHLCFPFLKGFERNLDVLLYYNYDKTQLFDSHGSELIIDPEDLKTLLKHRKSFVQQGPYDPTMPKEIQQAFTAFNDERTKILERGKAKLAPLNRLDNGIRLVFADEYYLSRFKTTAQLSAEDRLMLPRLFSECFELPNKENTAEKTQAFFVEKVLANTRYIYELFYQEHSLIPLAFLCLQLKALNHPEYGPFLCAHLSIAACSFSHSQKGLLTSSMKIILALKQYADEKHIPLKCYSRFVQPGIAFALLPDNVDMSTKYHRNEGFVTFVADQFNNKIEPDGTSLAPVRSKSMSTRGNTRIDAYRFFLNECLGADDKAALPVVIDINNEFVEALTEDLCSSADLQQAHVDYIQQQLRSLIDGV